MQRSVNFELVEKPYTMKELAQFVKDSVSVTQTIGTKKGVYYYNVAAAFDIETTSFYVDENGQPIDFQTKQERKAIVKDYNPEKVAIMYVWQFGINGRVIMGRTWQEFLMLCYHLQRVLKLDEKRRFVVYVHNLAFEFQFMRKWLKWLDIFSTDERKPLKALCEYGIEFRCSLMLSGYSLANLSRDLHKYKIEKKSGDLDYSLLRHCKTPLTEKEIGYCVYDVLTVMAYIQEYIERNRDISKIPLTKTGVVRTYCRENTLYVKNHRMNLDYRKLMNDLFIKDENEFFALQRAFGGGFTHANAFHSGSICADVTSYDFTSSYPYVMLAEKYPMSKATVLVPQSEKQFRLILSKYLSIFDVSFHGLRACINQENYLSVSKCFEKTGVIENNGRVVMANSVSTTITNIDFDVMERCYNWDSIQIGNMYIYHSAYLPKEFTKCILEFYGKKTTLKGVKGMEIEYMLSKNMLNACYGMAVTSPIKPEFAYNDEWETIPIDDMQAAIDDYNSGYNRFLYYIWGVFVTAYARRNLFTGILEMGQDYIYSDTDSIKIFNAEKHKEYFDGYNRNCIEKLKKAAAFHKLPFNLYNPKTKDGIEKPLGVWDYDGHYDYFKTLGAKRYLCVYEGASGEIPFTITVSGVNKKFAVPYMWETANHDLEKVLKMFDENLCIPCGKSGKNLHTYIDDEKQGILTDYLGITAAYDEKSSVHLEATEYNLSMAAQYVAYLKGVRQIEF